jgi:hypothetical protein
LSCRFCLQSYRKENLLDDFNDTTKKLEQINGFHPAATPISTQAILTRGLHSDLQILQVTTNHLSQNFHDHFFLKYTELVFDSFFLSINTVYVSSTEHIQLFFLNIITLFSFFFSPPLPFVSTNKQERLFTLHLSEFSK